MALFVLFLSLAIGLYESDLFSFKVQDKLTHHCNKKIRQHLRESGILAYWSLNKPIVRDLVSNQAGLNGKTVLVPGRFGKGRWFCGNKDNAILMRYIFKNLGNFYTYSFWIKPLETGGLQPILSNKQQTIPQIWIENHKLFFNVPNRQNTVLSIPFSRRDQFVHIACTADLKQKKACLYEDGVLKASAALDKCYTRTDEMLLGQSKNNQPLNYILDEFVIRNWAMTRGEVLEESRAGSPLVLRLKPSLALELNGIKFLRRVTHTAARGFDLLNPFYHESRITKANLPQFYLTLSKKDLKAFNKFHHLSLAHGLIPREISSSRKIQIEAEGKVFTAQMELAGEVLHLDGEKKTFSIEFSGEDQLFGMRKIIFVPPESNGFLRPLFTSALARKYHLPSSQNGMGVVWINGTFKGLYFFDDANLFRYSVEDNKSWDVEPFLKELPALKRDLLATYDTLEKTYLPLFVRDRTSFLSSREIRYRMGRDRKRLTKLSLEDVPPEDSVRLKRVGAFLSERLILGDNPGPKHILQDLDLSLKEMDGVKIQWKSGQPQTIDDFGRVRRPTEGPPVEVPLQADLSCGSLSSQKMLRVRVMPRELKLGILRLDAASEIQAFEETPCLAQWIEPPAQHPTGPFSGKIKLHGNSSLNYPKKSYKVEFDREVSFMDFTPSRSFFLLSSYKDPTFLKNHLTYSLFRDFSKSRRRDYASKHYLVDLFLNHAYLGIYELTERVDGPMLGLNPYKKEEPVHSVLYKAVGQKANFATNRWAHYAQKVPHPQEGEYREPFDELLGFLGNASAELFKRDAPRILDIENIIDFQILVNFTFNRDGSNHNLYLARNNNPGDKFFLIPWDSDKTLGGPHDQIISNHLFHRLMMELPSYNEGLRMRWAELRRGALSEAELQKKIGAVQDQIQYSVEENFNLWPMPQGETHEKAVEETWQWMKRRLAFMDGWVEGLGAPEK